MMSTRKASCNIELLTVCSTLRVVVEVINTNGHCCRSSRVRFSFQNGESPAAGELSPLPEITQEDWKIVPCTPPALVNQAQVLVFSTERYC